MMIFVLYLLKDEDFRSNPYHCDDSNVVGEHLELNGSYFHQWNNFGRASEYLKYSMIKVEIGLSFGFLMTKNI